MLLISRNTFCPLHILSLKPNFGITGNCYQLVHGDPEMDFKCCQSKGEQKEKQIFYLRHLPCKFFTIIKGYHNISGVLI